MPDRRTHRGPHPDDARLFAPSEWPALRQAVGELSWLLTRGYAATSAIKLVGDRHRLDHRQRMAISRSACSDAARERRCATRQPLDQASGQSLAIDGYNVLTSIEAALAGGVILHARDGCFRDLASVHGTWRKVQETIPAVEILGRFLAGLGVRAVRWYLDRPVSNSGRLKAILAEAAAVHGWPWEVELVPNPDSILSAAGGLIATADSGILDSGVRWVNLARETIERYIPEATIVKLADESEPVAG